MEKNENPTCNTRHIYTDPRQNTRERKRALCATATKKENVVTKTLFSRFRWQH